ncbi:40S ribosomal protein S5-1 [Hordeum vulgare]|nr:40S ribosomal protein S5-1 [Hordeum vulgare]
MLHIRDVEGPKKTGSVETRLEAMEQQVFKCQGMVERGLNANHMMITEFTSKHKLDAIDIGKHLSRLYDRVDQLQDCHNNFSEPSCEIESGTSLEKTPSDPGTPSSHCLPKAATTSRRKINSYEEDVDFIPEESAPQKHKEKTTVRKTLRKK